MEVTTLNIFALGIFLCAVTHTFLAKKFEHLAHTNHEHAGIFHVLGEIEAVFGFWAAPLIFIMIWQLGHHATLEQLGHMEANYTEAMFVTVIMIIAASKPIKHTAEDAMRLFSRILPGQAKIKFFFSLLFVGPLLGSFITEPAAMTLTAFILRDNFFTKGFSERAKYLTLAALLVNVSIGGTLTPYAAPPVLMVAHKWHLGMAEMIGMFGYKAAIAVFINAILLTYLLRKEFGNVRPAVNSTETQEMLRIPPWMKLIYLSFLALVVYHSHYPVIFVGIFMFFLGVTKAYWKYQEPLIVRESLMVGFFLAGLVALGKQQAWWISWLMDDVEGLPLYFGSIALTAITDNAALTYLGSLVPDASANFKYFLLAGAVSGGGLTVIANAPNPAAFAILDDSFDEGSISAVKLLKYALIFTVIAMAAFLLLPSFGQIH